MSERRSYVLEAVKAAQFALGKVKVALADGETLAPTSEYVVVLEFWLRAIADVAELEARSRRTIVFNGEAMVAAKAKSVEESARLMLEKHKVSFGRLSEL